MPDTRTGSVSLDNLFAGEFPIVRSAVTVADGQTLTRGAVLGIVTATGYAKLLDTTAVDGSQTFHSVLLEDVTTSGATQVAPVALTGEFASDQLSFGGTTVAADVLTAMRALSCFQQTLSDSVVGE
jgi:hypothetical protein